MYWSALILLAASGASAQLTAQSSVAPGLRECYINGTLLNRNNLPPTTIPVLIDIIRQIEDNPNVNFDLRQLAVLLLHTYRQDGIEFHPTDTQGVVSVNVLPYAPTFHSFFRHRLLLSRIIPNNQNPLANDTIPAVLKCALHHMLSTTVDARVRGDEQNCNQMQQYRAMRTIRDIRNIDDDVEILDDVVLKNHNKNGQMRQYNPKDDVEVRRYGASRSERQLEGESQCPLLSGVVHTNWGAISAGTVIAGIASGAQTQQVPVMELAKGSALNYNDVQQYITSLYPATLSGDLAEAVLIQGTERGSSSISIGSAGGWNSTEARRFWMLHNRINIEMTDPEIRGGVDGFLLGATVNSQLQTYSSLKLSQLLDMYYSPRNGVFNSQFRACNRRALAQQNIAETTLISETYAFAAALDTNMPLRGTITGGLNQLVSSAVQSFQNYMTNNLNDMTCVTTIAADINSRAKTNLYIVLDASWQYLAVYPAISYLLDQIEVNKFGSSVTLLSAADGSVVVNTTWSLANFHMEYTQARHQAMLTSVNLEATYTNVRTMMQTQLDNESVRNYVGGNATVLLFMLNAGNLNVNDRVREEARILNETVPDLRVLFATSSNQFDNLWPLVRDMHNDIMTVAPNTQGTNIDMIMSTVRNRIRQVGRRIINPLCGSKFNREGTSSGTRQFEDYVEPGYVNFYAISPNYFYVNNDNRRVRIIRASSGSGSLVICHSRIFAQPSQNVTTGAGENDITCQSLAASGNIEISLQNLCAAYWTINSCPLLYISVQSSATPDASTTAVCTDNHCRFPYDIRYQVQIEEFGCFSSASGVSASLAVIILAFFIQFYKL
ncbi:hypothetical protein O0L34_g9609 [Tuta absoluta]|nr:hypothetical protein O0L34_g9609 [Tuta absoluta]